MYWLSSTVMLQRGKMNFIKKHPWVLYILIGIIYVGLSTYYPYLKLQYQRGLFLGKGEVPWGSVGLGISILLTKLYIDTKFKT